VSSDDFYVAVLAFLDQFIERGAASDVLELRYRLEHDPEARQRLEDQLPSKQPTERKAFDAMTAFFDAEYERGDYHEPSVAPNLFSLLIDWTSWGPRDADSPTTR
jgi:hypothetical protein